MAKVILNEEAIKHLEVLLGEVPFKWSAPIMQVLNQNFVAEETTPPIGGGGGSPIKPPKSE